MREVTASPVLRLPLLVKIRILASTEATVRLCTQLALAGASLIAIHGRQRGRVEQRRDGAADLSVIRAVKRAVDSHCLPVHILTNGNVCTADDVLDNLRYTQADGAMVAEAISKDPALFLGCLPSSSEQPSAPSPMQLARLYLSYVRECDSGLGWSADELWLRLVGHIHRVSGAELRRLQLSEASIERPCSIEAFDCLLQQAVERAEAEVRSEWRADLALDEEVERSRERRQRMMEVVRARVRQRERMGRDKKAAADASGCTRPLNSKERQRKRRREEKVAQQREQLQAEATTTVRDDG